MTLLSSVVVACEMKMGCVISVHRRAFVVEQGSGKDPSVTPVMQRSNGSARSLINVLRFPFSRINAGMQISLTVSFSMYWPGCRGRSFIRSKQELLESQSP